MAQSSGGKGDGGATWVGSGSFRVDRRKALEKLSKFQLADASHYLLCWVRAAAAAGATRVAFRRFEGGLKMEFDGRRFTQQELSDPYGVLFEKERPKNASRRHVAIGLLAALRLRPGAIDIFYGAGPGRRHLAISSLGDDKTVPVSSPDTDTVIRVTDLGKRLAIRRALDHVRERCAMSPADIRIDGARLARIPIAKRASGHHFSDGPVRGWLTIPDEGGVDSVVDLYVYGVHAGQHRIATPAVRVRGHVNSDELRLDASQARVVSNDRLRSLERLLEDHSRGLLDAVARRLAKRLPAVQKGLLESSRPRTVWRELMERGGASRSQGFLGAAGFALWRLIPKNRENADSMAGQVRWCARALRWARDLAARHLTESADDAGDPFRLLLWRMPLFLNLKGEPLSLERLEELEAAEGAVPYALATSPLATTGGSPGKGARAIVWFLSSKETALLLERCSMRDVS
ncbi:MAG: hypothetical protein ABII00_11950 [Elusimicrobiota bacterium]